MGTYGGAADAILYFRSGLVLADRIRAGDISGFLEGASDGGRWWGTPFVEQVSGAVLAVIGPNLKAEFLVFALISFVGLYVMAKAVDGVTLPRRSRRFAALVFLWPSLWFWPSIVGKEALVILGVGLSFLGYLGTDSRSQWVWLVLGVAVTFCTRPHVAMVVVAGIFLAHFFRPRVRFSLARAGQLAAIAVAVWAVLLGMANVFGLEELRQEQVTEFVLTRSENTLRGGSNMGEAPIREGKPWLAFPNFWLRPFPWEVNSFVGIVAASEIIVLWAVLFTYRKTVWRNLKRWRESALLRFAIPVLLGYSLMIGSVIGNLGILVRQRTIVLPLAFLLVVADTRHREKSRHGAVERVLRSDRVDLETGW